MLNTNNLNVNEKCLIDFLTCSTVEAFGPRASLVNLLATLGVEIKYVNPNPLYDIVDSYEYS